MRRRAWIIIAAAAVGAAGALAEPATTAPAVDERLDAEVFRRGLRERGLTELLQLFDRDHPPADEVARTLRERDDLLALCDDASCSAADRARACTLATEILERLASSRPNDPRRLQWLCDRGRDLVERRAAVAIDAMLFRVASPAQRTHVAATMDAALTGPTGLEALADAVAAEWKRIDALPPDEYAALAATDRMRALESVEASSAYLLAWARLYRAMVLPKDDPRRAALLVQVIDAVTRHRWAAVPHERSGLQMQALLMAAVAARLAGRFDAADAATQQAIAVYTRVPDGDARRKLDSWILLAVLERVRTLADRGAAADAVAAAARAREWADKSRSDDVPAIVAVELLRRSLSPTSTTAPAAGDDSLLMLARQNAASRPLVYEGVGWLAVDRKLDADSAVGLDRLALAWVLAGESDRVDDAARVAESLAADAADPFLAAEALYALARCRSAQSRPTEAAEALLRLVREHADSDRAAAALRAAVQYAATGMTETASVSRVRAHERFVQAVRLLRARAPADPRLPELSFAAGAAMQQLARWRDAADEFAQVAPSAPRAAEAALQRMRCLVKLFEADPNERTASAAVAAAEDVQRRIESMSNVCWAAEAALTCAGVQADPALKQYNAALRTLADFETCYAACTDLMKSLWRVRLTAMEALGRLKEANALIARIVEHEPDRAGDVMSGLLARLIEKIEQSRDAGDDADVRELAAEAVTLAGRLERWSADRAPQNVAAIRVARAMAMLDADQIDAARALADAQFAASQPAGAAPVPAWRFVRAECFYRAQAYRDALPLFHDAWQAADEGGTLWWRALLRNLQCHTELGGDPDEILQAIRQQRFLHKDMGGPALRRAFDALQQRNEQRRKPAR